MLFGNYYPKLLNFVLYLELFENHFQTVIYIWVFSPKKYNSKISKTIEYFVYRNFINVFFLR